MVHREPPPPRPAPQRVVTTALFALAPDTVRKQALPLIEDAVLRAEALHRALVNFSDPDNTSFRSLFDEALGRSAAPTIRGRPWPSRRAWP